MISQISLLIFAIYIYGLYVVKKQSHLNPIKTGVCLFVCIIMFIFVNTMYVDISMNLWIALIFELILFFALLQIKKRVPILFSILFIISIGIITYLATQNKDLILLSSYLLVFTFLLAVSNQVLMRKSFEESAVEFQNKLMGKHVEEVQHIYTRMRSWRHDYHNHLQKLKAHIILNQIDEVKKYLDELEIDLGQVNQLVETGNLNVDAILNSKLSLAISEKIDLTFKARVPNELSITDIDLCVLIGNLIDNAIEACIKMNTQEPKFIRLYIGVFKEQLYISVSNATDEVIRKLDHEYITSKRGNHGHGLKRINKIVLKYNGYINRQNEPGVFVTEVLLPL